MISELVESNAIIFAFIMEWVIIVCLIYFQQNALVNNVNTYLLVDFVSFELKIQLALLNPSFTTRKPI